MAHRIFTNQAFTPGATADNATVGTTGFMALKGGSATQMLRVKEFMLSGFAAASALALMTFARASTLGVTPTTLAAPASDGPMHPSTAALAAPAVSYIAAGTGPVRSNAVSDGKINLGFNAFGGILKYNAGPEQEWVILTATAPLGESVLSGYTGTTATSISADIIYEPM